MNARGSDNEIVAWLREVPIGGFVRGFTPEDFPEPYADAADYAEAYTEMVVGLILGIAGMRGITLKAEERERILGCKDLDSLGRWLDAVPNATTAEELFG